MQDLEALDDIRLGSLCRRLTEHLYQAVDRIYEAVGIRFKAAWFPVIYLLSRHDALRVGEMAERSKQTHAAISQLCRKLQQEGLLERDENGERGQAFQLTSQGLTVVEQLTPVWADLKNTLHDYVLRTGTDILPPLLALEEELERGDLVRDVLATGMRRRARDVEIIDYHSIYRAHFRRLNVEWLEKYFQVEPHDEGMLEDPERFIIKPGGAVVFARYGESIIGTCALIYQGDGVYELAKMAVTEAWQGAGLGRRLGEACIAKYVEKKGDRLFLESNTRLHVAIRLYRSLGFEEKTAPESPYARANIYMEYARPRQADLI